MRAVIPGATHSFRYVRTPLELDAFADEWLPRIDGGVIALDIEESREFTYRPRIALIQVTVDGADAVLDPVELGNASLAAMVEAICLTADLVIAHGCNNDVSGMKRDFGIAPVRLRDTQVAARFCGAQQFGLAALLESHFGVRLDKSLRRSDWSLRPLGPDLLEYARSDTRHLLGLWDALYDAVCQRGWEDATVEECDALAALPAEKPQFDELGWVRVRGATDLDPAGQDRAAALWAWRDGVGSKYDINPSRVLAPWGLVLLAERGTRGLRGARACGIPSAIYDEHFDLLNILLADPPPAARPNGKKRREFDNLRSAAEQQARVEKLVRWRDATAIDLGLEAGFLAPRGVLEAVARLPTAHPDEIAAVPEVRQWRVVRFAEQWYDTLR